MAAAKLTAPEVAVEHFAFGSKEEFYIEHLKFKKDAEDKMIFPKKELKAVQNAAQVTENECKRRRGKLSQSCAQK